MFTMLQWEKGEEKEKESESRTVNQLLQREGGSNKRGAPAEQEDQGEKEKETKDKDDN